MTYLLPRPARAALFAAALVLSWVTCAVADVGSAVRQAEQAAGGPLRVRLGRDGRTVAFLAAASRRGIPLGNARAAAPLDRSRAFLERHGNLFGMKADDARLLGSGGVDETGMQFTRLRQMSRGVEVTGAGLTLHTRNGEVVSALARTVPDAGRVAIEPSLDAEDARMRAAALLETLNAGELTLAPPRLELFSRGLLDHSDTPTRLAWFVEARSPSRREWIWIDAHSGEVLLNFDHVADALNRQIFDAMNTAGLGTLARSEGGPPAGSDAVDLAYDYSGDTYNYFMSEHGRDSFNGAGATMVASVNSTVCGSPCFNAYWNGSYTIFGLNFTVDDIVGHEWTHGVTQYEAELIYFMESGAMNESFSDIFGETVDLLNGTGSDGPAERWWIGEDILPGILQGIRYMYDPNVAQDPGHMSDPAFVCNDGSVDSGGVHSNSGIGNHAYALMVDGGSYNGYTVTGIGLTKAAKIEYRALSQYLIDTSTYADLYDALTQSCVDLIGTAGITLGNCVEMQKALDAVEMSAAWPCVSGTPTPTPTTTPTATPTVTPTPATACGFAPRTGCGAAAQGLVLFKRNPSNPGGDMLTWKWLKGSAGQVFGDPTASATYTLCAYDADGGMPLIEVEVPSGSGWDAGANGAYKYAGDLSAGGMGLIKLKPGSGTARILVKGKGTNLTLPPLGFTQPLTLQLVKDDGPLCWESVFAGPPRNSTTMVFKDKIP